MDLVQKLIGSIGSNGTHFLVFVLIFAVGSILLGGIGRFAFGKRSMLNQSVSSTVGILFVYALMFVLWTLGASFSRFVSPLPFITFGSGTVEIFSFYGAHYTSICSELLAAVTLAFIANLIDGFIPRGKNIFTWLLFRCLTVVLAAAAHWLASYLIAQYLPEGLLTYAPVILLALIVLFLLVGALKVVVGALLATVNPLIGAFYTFFFATIVGKALTRALLTAALLSAIVFLLNYLDISTVAIDSAALIAYVPFLLILLLIWYLIGFIL